VKVTLFHEKPKKFYHPEVLEPVSSHADFLKLELSLFCTFDLDKILQLVFGMPMGIIMVVAKFS
jgi:hypothetical protein